MKIVVEMTVGSIKLPTIHRTIDETMCPLDSIILSSSRSRIDRFEATGVYLPARVIPTSRIKEKDKTEMNRRSFLISAASAALTLSAMTASIAQAPVTSVPWHPSFGPVVMGRGLGIYPQSISVVGGTGVLNTPYKWQQDSQELSVLDYSSIASTMQSLNANAWGEASDFFTNFQFSVDYSQYSAFQGNHRHWEVDANHYQTAFLPSVQLTAAAKASVNNLNNFEAEFGDYVVTGIRYRQRIIISWDVIFNSSISQSQFNSAISGSYSMFSGGASVNTFYQQLQSFAQCNVTVTIEGQNGGPVLSTAISSTDDLNSLITAVQQLLDAWNATPSDPTQAGTVDTVYVTPYTAIPGGPSVVPAFAPNQTDLANAISQYIYLDQCRTRLMAIQNTDTNLNPRLINYIAARLAAVTTIRTTAIAYVKSLMNNTPPATAPNLQFQFDDPDVVKWHVIEYLTCNGVYYPIIEMYTNAQTTPSAPDGGSSPNIWCAKIQTVLESNGSSRQLYNGLVAPPIPEANTYQTSLDPVTGIPHRYVALQWHNSAENMAINLIDGTGNPFYNAIDWNGAVAPTIAIPQTSWRNIESGTLLEILVGGG
jgi:hypothetical protein